MNNIKISVIIPIYNVEKYLNECLDSVINQTFRDIEIICVNDGSPDNCLSIIKNYAKDDQRIVIIDKENGGYASAINAGLKIARGEFIQIVESDDICALDMLEELYNKIKDSDADLVTADFYFKKGDSNKICKYLRDEDSKIDQFSIKTLPYIIAKEAYPWKSLYRKSFLDKHSICMIQDGKGAYEDQPWNATILTSANKILYVNKPLYYYRLDATGSSTNNGGKKMINYIYRKAQTKEILEKNNLYRDDIKEHYIHSAVGGCLFFFKRISFEFKEEYYNEMKGFLNSLICEDLEYKYFSAKNKKRLENILKKTYKNYFKFEILKNKLTNFIKRSY